METMVKAAAKSNSMSPFFMSSDRVEGQQAGESVISNRRHQRYLGKTIQLHIQSQPVTQFTETSRVHVLL
jgi:hypothetical protein